MVVAVVVLVEVVVAVEVAGVVAKQEYCKLLLIEYCRPNSNCFS